MGRTEVANSGGLSSLYMSRIGFWKHWNSLLRFTTQELLPDTGPTLLAGRQWLELTPPSGRSSGACQPPPGSRHHTQGVQLGLTGVHICILELEVAAQT